MNKHPGTLGIKLGMTQIFNADGTVDRVTVVDATCFVVGKRTMEKDGYSALIVGIGERKEKHTTKPVLGQFKKIEMTPKQTLKEFRLAAEVVAEYNVGDKLPIDKIFEVGQIVDVQAKSRGRGFTGVMARYNFSGMPSTHGTHEYRRHGGSIGTNMTPGRTLPGVRMPGHKGDKIITVHNQRIVRVDAEKGIILLDGGIPGSRNHVVSIRGAVKKMGGKKK
jgi:large subunit ribosomal protein L3